MIELLGLAEFLLRVERSEPDLNGSGASTGYPWRRASASSWIAG